MNTWIRVGLNRKYSKIQNPFSSSLARRSAFCKSQDNLETSFMDTNGDLGMMSHVGHVRRTPELSQENGLNFFFKRSLTSIKCHKCHIKCHTRDIFNEENGLWIMEYSG